MKYQRRISRIPAWCLVLAVAGMMMVPRPGLSSDLNHEFNEAFQALVPPPNSSVNSDYLFEQAALGSRYTVEMLDRIYQENRQLNEKYDRMIEAYDLLLEQNREMISLLKQLAEK